MMLLKSNELSKKLLDMNQHYLELVKYLEEIAQHPELILDPAHQVFLLEPRLYDDSKTNHRNHPNHVPVRTRLYKKDNFDQLALDLVKSAAASMAKKMCSYMANQLPGGKLWAPSEEQKQILRNVNPTNDSLESLWIE